MSEQRNDSAASDAELVRYIDGELEGEERARVEDAVASDPQLAARLDTLRRRQQRLQSMLTRTDPPVPDRRAAVLANVPSATSSRTAPAGSQWLLRAAAVILVLAGIVSLVPPLRAWIVDQLVRVTAPDPAAPPPPPPLSDVPDTVGVEFSHSFQNFDFELVNAQRAGSIRIIVADVETVQAEIRTRTGREEFFRIPEGLRIVNAPGTVADYEITLPSTIRRVRVVVGGREVEVYSTRSADGRDRVFPLP